MGTPATNRQVPDQSVLDHFNKQTYLGNQFTGCFQGAIASTTEDTLFLLSNPMLVSGQSQTTAKALFVNLMRILALTATQSAVIRVYLNPTVTDPGTPQTPVNARPGNANAATGVLTLQPTVSSNGTLIDVMSSLSLAEAELKTMRILDAGESLLLTVQASVNPTTVATTIGWYEL